MKKPPDPATDAAIAEYIATHGVTRCPAAAVGETTASMSEADQQAIKKHAADLEELAAAYGRNVRVAYLTPAQRELRKKLAARRLQAYRARKKAGK